VSEGLYLVFSQPPADLPPGEYERWYAQHLRENLQVDGFRGGRRFALDHTVNAAESEAGFSHLAQYECTAEIAQLRAALDRRRESGEIVLPPWFGDITFSSWYCRPLEERVGSPIPSGKP